MTKKVNTKNQKYKIEVENICEAIQHKNKQKMQNKFSFNIYPQKLHFGNLISYDWIIHNFT
jgi:hypothetical protein